MTRVLIVAFLLTSAAYAGESQILTSTGLGSFRIGMDFDHLQRVVHDKLPYTQYVNNGCGVVTAKHLEPYGISFMLESNILTRINVDFYGTDKRPLDIETAAGIGLASSEDDLLKAYAGKTRIVPNPGDPSWHTIYVDDPDQKHALIFETDGKKVKSMRAGAYPGVSYPNGCD